MTALMDICWRDLGVAFRSGGWLLPIIFFLLVATLFPFAIGPDPALIAQVGGGALWTAALLAALLPVDRLIAPDLEASVLDQYAVRGLSEEGVAVAKIFAHWLSFGPPLLLAVIPASILLGLDGETIWRLEAGLALGTPGLAALALMVSALVAGLRTGGTLSGLLMLPLAVPMLIFGAGAVSGPERGGFYLLAAASLLLVAVAPFAAGAAIRESRQ